MKSNTEERQLYEIARVIRAGAEVGVVYAAELPYDPDALVAEVTGDRVRLRRARTDRAPLAELSLSELVALGCACRAWETARVGFTSIRQRVRARGYGSLIVQPADLSLVVTRKPVSPRPVASDVLQVAELRIADGRPNAGALAGALFVIPNDWTLEMLDRRAALIRGQLRLELGVQDGLFVETLATTLAAQVSASRAAASEQTPSEPRREAPEAPTSQPVTETAAEDDEDPFRL